MNAGTPLYEQIYRDIIEKIELGHYRSGDRLPSEEQLCRQYSVSRVTLRKAVGKLVSENLLVTRSGKGTFVAMPVFVEAAYAESSFTKSCLVRSAVPSTRLIDKEIIQPTVAEADSLKLEKGASVIRIKRLRHVNGIACIFEIDYFYMDFKFVLDADLEHIPLLEIIRERTGLTAGKNESVIDVRKANKEHAKWLECPVGEALLCVCQAITSSEQRPLYYNEQFIRSDRYKYVVGR